VGVGISGALVIVDVASISGAAVGFPGVSAGGAEACGSASVRAQPSRNVDRAAAPPIIVIMRKNSRRRNGVRYDRFTFISSFLVNQNLTTIKLI